MFSPLVSMSHLTLNFFLNFALSFSVDKLAQIKRNEIRIFFSTKIIQDFFFILRMILKNEIENQKGKKEGKKEEMRDFDIIIKNCSISVLFSLIYCTLNSYSAPAK